MPFTGVIETAAAQGWRIIRHHVPEVKQVVVKRPVQEVYEAMLNIDLQGYATYDERGLRKIISYGDRMLDEISALPDTLTLNFSDLDTREGCKKLFEFCLPYQFEGLVVGGFESENIQVSVPEYINTITSINQTSKVLRRRCGRSFDILRNPAKSHGIEVRTCHQYPFPQP